MMSIGRGATAELGGTPRVAFGGHGSPVTVRIPRPDMRTVSAVTVAASLVTVQ